jgi:homoserine dehydrogenase
MKIYKLALIGFGNVGQGLARILSEKYDFLKSHHEVDIRIVAVCDAIKGSVANAEGLDPAELLDQLGRDGDLRNMHPYHNDWNATQTIERSGASIMLELTPTHLSTGEPALTHVKQALQRGMHVSMPNKGPLVTDYPALRTLAKENGAVLGVEGTVMSGTPALCLARESLMAAGISQVQGILNGTTNYMLDAMEHGCDFETALAQAQSNGYAEADPSGDVDGHDAAAKVVILGNLLMDLPLSLQDVACEGISGLTQEDIQSARDNNQHWKLLATIKRNSAGYHASVKPERISADHPLASVRGATNAITYQTEILGEVTLIGPGAGRMETGFALVEDILAIHSQCNHD